MKHLSPSLAKLQPCPDGVRWWLKNETDQAAWTACQRGDWMLWLLGSLAGPINSDSHRQMTACKAACARLVLDIFESRRPGDKRPRGAIEAAERYAEGQPYATDAAAYAAAYAAADAAYAAARTAAYAAYAAAYAAYAAAYADAYAAYAAADAAYAAAAAAAAAAADAAAAYAAAAAAADAAAAAAADAARAEARSKMLARCADEVRKAVPNFPL
jgi:hypothetical protein